MTATLLRRSLHVAPRFHGGDLQFGDLVTARNPFGNIFVFPIRVWGRTRNGRRWVAGDCGRSVLLEHICTVERDGRRL